MEDCFIVSTCRRRDFAVPMSTNRLLNELAEAEGKPARFTRQ